MDAMIHARRATRGPCWRPPATHPFPSIHQEKPSSLAGDSLHRGGSVSLQECVEVVEVGEAGFEEIAGPVPPGDGFQLGGDIAGETLADDLRRYPADDRV